MKKIGIVTITGNPNYGNALQMIAMQINLQKLGYQSEIIINYDHSSLFKRTSDLKYYLKVLINWKNIRSAEKRRRRFLKCLNKYVGFSDAFYYDGKVRCFDSELYCGFVAGSDQIWNPFFGLASDFEMLSFVPPKKRISYAASFGVSNLNGVGKNTIDFISKSLKKFQAVSVREKAGVEIVSKVSGVKAELCLDPTMLMTAEEWDDITEKPKQKLPVKYIVVYMLGSITVEYEKEITSIAKERGAEIINLLSDDFFCLNPLEFVWIIKNSLFICTDSFHATVFSIIYHRKFRIFDRKDQYEDQNSRFDTLLEMCGIVDTNKIEWNVVDNCITQEKKNSLSYLKKALEKT